MNFEELVKRLIADGKGDTARLEHILSTLQRGVSLYTSDQEYVEKLLEEIKKSEKPQSVEEPIKTETKVETKQSPPRQLTEIEELRKEVHQLQDQNHTIEKHLKNQGMKKGSMARALGRGIGDVFLFLFGLGMVLLTYAHFDNIDSSLRSMSYGADPLSVMLYVFIVIPGILLSIAGASIYYGIRIISKT